MRLKILIDLEVALYLRNIKFIILHKPLSGTLTIEYIYIFDAPLLM